MNRMTARRDIAQEYVSGADELSPFFADDFRKLPDSRFIETVGRPTDPALVDEIESYNRQLDADDGALENIESLRSSDTLATVTGQQPGIFTGPLYTIYKALAAVRLAERYSATLNRKVIPIFWVASDDHDFEEIRTIRFVDWRGRIQSLSYDPEGPISALSAFSIQADKERLGELVQQLREETPDREAKQEIVSLLKDSLGKDDSLADWFARLLVRLFRGTGLVVFLPHKPRAKGLAARVLAEEIKSPGATTEIIDRASRELERLGYPAQIEKKPNEAHFFLHVNGKRRKVLFERGAYHVPDENLSLSVSEMKDICSSEPERVSPNVVLRTVVQGKMLPALDYVAGPGEIAYWAQLRAVFERFNVAMPRVFPRPHVVLINRRSARLSKRYKIDFARMSSNPETEVDKSSPRDKVSESSRRLMAELERYVAEISAVNPSLSASAGRLKQKVEYEIGKLNQKTSTARGQQTEQMQNEIEEIRTLLFPLGKPQERVFNIFPYLMESGLTLIPRLVHDLDVDKTDYQPILT